MATTAQVAPNKWLQDLTLGLDMLKNFNFSQISDALQTAAADPITAVEHVAEIAVHAATVAGVPYAGTVEEFLPWIEDMVGLAHGITNIFGGPSGQAAQTATAISSPPVLKPAVLTTAVVGTSGKIGSR